MKIQILLFHLVGVVVSASTVYDVTIYTGDEDSAGTDANVFMRLIGQHGTSLLVPISAASSTNLKKSSVNKFNVDFKKDVGTIYSIVIGHDNTGNNPALKLSKVKIKKSGSPLESTFLVNKWLKKSATQSTYVKVERQETDNCGDSTVPQGRVVNGATSILGQWPWQTKIRKVTSTLPHHCGGTLIHPQYVLTASHCFQRDSIPKDFEVTMGDHDITKLEASEQTVTVNKIIMHDGWNPITFDHDIAIVKLNRPVLLNNNVKLACLPNHGVDVAAGKNCIISGWGSTRSGGKGSDQLLQATLPVVEKSKCIKTMKSLFPITKNMLCGGGNFNAACHGDSGGPYVCANNAGRYTVEGVVSWGHPRCIPYRFYSVFARVSEHVNWIKSSIYSNYIDPTKA